MAKRLPRFVARSRAAAAEARAIGDGLNRALWSATNTTGVDVNERSALTLSAAFACINVIATDVSCLPLRIYRRRPDGGRVEVPDHPAADLLRWSPDGEATSMSWRRSWMGHALGWGNAFARIWRDGAGRPFELELIDPGTIEARRRKSDNRLFYVRDTGGTLRADEVLHLAGLGFDGISGYSPVRLFRQAIALGLAAEIYGSSFFGNNAQPRGFLKTPKKLSPEAVKNLRASFESMHRGVHNAHRLAVLEEGMEYQQTALSPEDAQYLATRQFQVIEVCRIYRVPPNKVGDYSQAHLANVEASNLDYLTTTVMPWCEAQEQLLNLKLLTRAERLEGLYVEHQLAAFLRGDMRARAEFYKTLRDLGVLSPNDICRFENLNPLGPEGDIRLVPMNMATLANAGGPAPTPAKGKSNA